MTPLRAAWLLGLVALAGGSWVMYATCPGCIDRSRVNTACEWTRDSAFPIEPQHADHRKHLVGDAHLAEELAIRHADAEHERRFGVEHHGGLLDGGRFRAECLSRMLGAIENSHDVTSEQVQLARGERNWTFDVAVSLLVLPLYLLGGIAASRWLSRRLSTHDRFVRLVGPGMASVAVSFLALQGLRLWAAVWEVIRVGNGHMTSIRAASKTGWMHHADGQLMGATLLFLLIALCCSRVGSTEHPDDARRPDRVLLH